MRKLIKKILNENEWEWAINSKPTWSTYYTSLLNEIKKLPNNLEDVTLKMLEPIWMRLSTTNKLLKKGVEPQEMDTDLAIEYMIDDPWPNKKVLLPNNDVIDIIEKLFIRLMIIVEDGERVAQRFNDVYMASQQSTYTSKKLTLISYINGLISQLTLINESDGLQWIKDVKSNQDIAQEIADETKVDYVRSGYYVNYPYHSNSSISISQNIPSNSFPKHCKEQYGLNDDGDINNVWERYKEIIIDKINDHSNLNENESDDMQWIKDIPTLVDITPGMCLRDQQGSQWSVHNFPTNYPETDKNKWVWLIRTHTEGQKIIRRHPHPFKRVDLNDRLVVGDLSVCDNTLKESDDLQWIRDIKPYIPFEEAEVGHHYNVHITNVVGFNIALNDCGEPIDANSVSQVKVLGTSMEQYHSIYCHDNDFIPYWPSMKLSLDLELLDGNGKRLLSHWFASGDLIQLQEQ